MKNEKAQPVGRPREWTKEIISKITKNLEEWIDDPDNYYFIGFLNKYKLHPEQIERFCKYSEEFRDAYARVLRIQEERLVELGVSRKGDGNFIKFVLQNKAGWREKNEVSGDAANPLSLILDRISNKNKDLVECEIEPVKSIDHSC